MRKRQLTARFRGASTSVDGDKPIAPMLLRFEVIEGPQDTLGRTVYVDASTIHSDILRDAADNRVGREGEQVRKERRGPAWSGEVRMRGEE